MFLHDQLGLGEAGGGRDGMNRAFGELLAVTEFWSFRPSSPLRLPHLKCLLRETTALHLKCSLCYVKVVLGWGAAMWL